MVTVFTPVYNRAYIIPQLYDSLCRQTSKDFEWLIVDDGSTDNIDEIIAGFINDDKITIRFSKQPNGGKHRAINRGVSEANGELFFIVDSDDYLTDDAISTINREYKYIFQREEIAGVSFMRCRPDGCKIGSALPFDRYCCDAFELTYKIKAKGDMAEVYKTTILSKFAFPEIDNEKFCPEALVWFRIAQHYKMLWINKNIYVCEYLADGLTVSINRIRHHSPLYSMLFYSESADNKRIPLIGRLKAAINYWRFSTSAKINILRKFKGISLFYWWLYPIGLIYSYRDSK